MPRNPVKGDHDEIEEKPGLQVVSEHKKTAQTVVVKAEVGGKCWGRPTFAIFASRQRRQGASSISWVVHPTGTSGDFKGPNTTHERKGCDLGTHTDPNGIFLKGRLKKKTESQEGKSNTLQRPSIYKWLGDDSEPLRMRNGWKSPNSPC